jgi:hypothetical protein
MEDKIPNGIPPFDEYNYEIEEEKMVQQEDENFEKLIHVEIENNKLKNMHIKIRSELGSCENTI